MHTFTVSLSFTVGGNTPEDSHRAEAEIISYLRHIVLANDTDSLVPSFQEDHESGYDGPFISSASLSQSGVVLDSVGM